MLDRVVERRDRVADEAVPGAVERPQHDQVGARRDAPPCAVRDRAAAGDDPGHVRPVTVAVVRLLRWLTKSTKWAIRPDRSSCPRVTPESMMATPIPAPSSPRFSATHRAPMVVAVRSSEPRIGRSSFTAFTAGFAARTPRRSAGTSATTPGTLVSLRPVLPPSDAISALHRLHVAGLHDHAHRTGPSVPVARRPARFELAPCRGW